MDELVFQRESLRRALLSCIEILEKAAAEYDPDDLMPTEDLIGAFAAGGLQSNVKSYADMVLHRMEAFAASKKASEPGA